MVKRAVGTQPKVGDTVRVPWGLAEAVGDVVELQGPPGHQHVLVALPVLGSSGEVLDITTVPFPLDSVQVVDALVVDDRDVTPSGMDGWIHRYRVRIGEEEVTVNVWCSRTAEAMASHNDEIKSVVRDRGKSWALRAAKRAQPGRRALVTVRCDSSGPSTSYEYGHPDA